MPIYLKKFTKPGEKYGIIKFKNLISDIILKFFLQFTFSLT